MTLVVVALLSIPVTLFGVEVMRWASALGQAQQGFTGVSAYVLVFAIYVAVAAAEIAGVSAARARRATSRA